MKQVYFVFLICFFKIQSFAVSISVEDHPFEDSNNRYFLGISSPQDNENKAIKEAVENAYLNAITEVYGTELQISQKSTANMEDTSLSKVSLLKTKNIKFKKFEKIDQKISASKLQFIAKVLFRYNKQEIRAEQARINIEEKLKTAENQTTGLKESLNQVGTSESILHLGRLEIRAFAEGKEVTEADIEIDQKKFASTPLVIGNRFSVGEHKIAIKHPRYEDYEGSFSVNGSDPQFININLRNATGSVTIYSSPANAQVYLNDNLLGETPIKIETMPIGKPFSIKLKTQGYYDQIFENLILQKDENLKLHPILNKINPPAIDTTNDLNDDSDVDENACLPADTFDNSLEDDLCEDRD